MYDVAIVGSGFAGSLLAMICHRLGCSVILLEKGRHPRFTIGESSTPLTNLLLEELSVRYNLPAIAPLAKWGAWQKHYPDIACGLKRGFTFYHHHLGTPDGPDPLREEQLLVAASPNDQIADTHWYRPDFDHFFLKEAEGMGIEYLDETDLTVADESADGMILRGSRAGQPVEVRARFVVDATGPRGFLHKTLKLTEAAFPDYPQTQALYSHFTNVGSYAEQLETSDQRPPYPIDSAAVHHVFDGGWIWVLQFNNGVTSAGVAATTEAADCLQLRNGAAAWENLLELVPRLKKQFASAATIRPFSYIPSLSFQSGTTCGERWMQLPSAAAFVDPLLSTGFATTLLGISRLAAIIEQDWESDDFSKRISESAQRSQAELAATSRLIASLYASMNNFPVFVALSHLYFTAVIYSETVRRLGKPELAQSFLLHDHEYFGPRCREIFDRSIKERKEPEALCEDIIKMIEPLNLAGLGCAERRNWYPVDAKDLYDSAHKVQATHDEITALLARSGFDLTSEIGAPTAEVSNIGHVGGGVRFADKAFH